MPNCSPRYTFKSGKIKNVERMWVQGRCDNSCIHWKACRVELNGGSETVLPNMSHKEAVTLSETQEAYEGE